MVIGTGRLNQHLQSSGTAAGAKANMKIDFSTKNFKYTLIAFAVIGGIALTAAVYSWYNNPLALLKKEYTKAAPIPATKKIETKHVAVKSIVALDKKAASKKLKLSDELAKDDTKEIIATAQLPATDTTGKTDIMAVLDTEAGTTEIQTKEEPLSIFSLTNKRAIGVRYGFDTAAVTNYGAEIYGRWDVLRTGAIHWGLYTEVSSTSDAKAMISAEYRF